MCKLQHFTISLADATVLTESLHSAVRIESNLDRQRSRADHSNCFPNTKVRHWQGMSMHEFLRDYKLGILTATQIDEAFFSEV
jgi:hypothetical protein